MLPEFPGGSDDRLTVFALLEYLLEVAECGNGDAEVVFASVVEGGLQHNRIVSCGYVEIGQRLPNDIVKRSLYVLCDSADYQIALQKIVARNG